MSGDIMNVQERIQQAGANTGPYRAAQRAIHAMKAPTIEEIGAVLSDLRREVCEMYQRAAVEPFDEIEDERPAEVQARVRLERSPFGSLIVLLMTDGTVRHEEV